MCPQGSKLQWSVLVSSVRPRHLVPWKGSVYQLTFRGGRWGFRRVRVREWYRPSSGDVESEESLLRTVVGPNGLKNFVLPLIWMVNDFSLTIQRKHFNTLGIGTKFPLMSSFVCHTNLKSATTIVLLMSRCMSRWSRLDLGCPWVHSTVTWPNI